MLPQGAALVTRSALPCITISVCCMMRDQRPLPILRLACTSPRVTRERAAGFDDEALREQPLAAGAAVVPEPARLRGRTTTRTRGGVAVAKAGVYVIGASGCGHTATGRHRPQPARGGIVCDVYVNVNHGPGGRLVAAAGAGTPLTPVRDLGEHRVDVLALLQQSRCGDREQHQERLPAARARCGDFVEVEQLADLRQRQAEPLAAQDQLEAHALALAVDAVAAVARSGRAGRTSS